MNPRIEKSIERGPYGTSRIMYRIMQGEHIVSGPFESKARAVRKLREIEYVFGLKNVRRVYQAEGDVNTR